MLKVGEVYDTDAAMGQQVQQAWKMQPAAAKMQTSVPLINASNRNIRFESARWIRVFRIAPWAPKKLWMEVKTAIN